MDLVRFEADAEDDRVRLEWETATEVDHAGFFVRRSLQEDVEQTKENDRIEVIDVDSEETINFISPRGDNLTGAVYTFLDANVAENVTYYYFLESIDAGDSSEFHGPRSAVIAGETTSTPTPTASETETPTVTDTAPTARGTATTTMTPSATPTRTPTTRLIPTLTRTPTVGAYPAPATPEPTGSVTPTPSPSAGTAPAYPAPAYPVPGGTETPFSVGTATVEGTLTVTGEVTVTPSPTLSPTPSPTPREPGSFFEGADEAILLRLRIAIGTLVVVGLVFSGAVYYYYALPTEKPGEQTDSSHEN